MRYPGDISLLITDEGASQNQNEGAEGSVKKKKKKRKEGGFYPRGVRWLSELRRPSE